MNAFQARTLRWLALACLGAFAAGAPAATFVVNSSLDPGSGGCTAGECTLREAITAANATTTADTINFSFGTSARSSGPDPDAIITEVLIQPTTALPTITQPVTVNGYSVSGSLVNTDPVVSNARPRIRVDGALLGAGARGITVCANNVTIKGLSVTRFSQVGIGYGFGTAPCANPITGANVLGNFVGVASNGSTDAGNLIGIEFRKASGSIGSAAIADRNVISDNNANGIGITFVESSNSIILNNLIGTDKSGLQSHGNRNGINIGDLSNLTIGSASAPNLIANNVEAGITTANSSVVTGNDHVFWANRFIGNGDLAIDLLQFDSIEGVTLNDFNDADTGPNGLQNFPVITAASRVAGGIHLNGTLDVPVSAGTVNYTLGIYASSACDASGHGEGELLLGSRVVGFRGNATESFSFDHLTSVVVPFGSKITMTATGPDGTSELSACFDLDPPPLIVNSTNDVADGVCNAAHCSLRDAIIVANASAEGDLIRFNITSPASGELKIPLLSSLPTITAPVTIDGYSQPGTSVNTDPVVSNAVLRIRLDGVLATASDAAALTVCAPNTSIRGLSITGFNGVSQRSVIIGRDSAGNACATAPNNSEFAGNFVGLAADGVTSAPSRSIEVVDESITIGGPEPADRNVIAESAANGISIFSGVNQATGTSVLNNLIGTDKTATLNRGNGNGINFVASSGNNIIGSASAPNLIRFNARGINISSASTSSGNTWTHNRVFDNDFLGIDLKSDGPTANDANDIDSGPNGLQNFPVITTAERNASGIRIAGTLDVPAGTSNVPYTIGVYANPSCDSSGHGEGEFLLGSATVNLTQTSVESFQFVISTEVDLAVNAQITATATGPDGTSEYSACVAATDAPPGIVVDSTLDVGTTSGGCTVTGDSNECTLREAITLANTQVGPDLIRFELSGAGPFLILPDTLLPAITEALIIDGFSQQGAAPNAAAIGSDAVLQIELRDGASVAFGLMTCASDVTIQGLSFTQFDTAAIATQMNASASCSVQGSNVRILGNYIGIRPNGGGGSNAGGISVANTVVQIGGSALADRNIISNGTTFGVRVAGAASAGSVIQNNLIGTGEDVAVDLGNIAAGIEINNASDITVGGEGPLGNLIAFNNSGVLILGSGTGNRVYANEFVGNDTLGIDLSTAAGINGVTANDINDTDSGPNNLQNFPVLSDASATPSSLTFNGLLDVPAGIAAPLAYTLAFYESTSCDGSGNGEGFTYLGSQSVDFTSGSENFSVTLPIAPASGATAITATATDPAGNTSEFSNCLAGPRPEPIFADSFE
jgi:trimeric autotransporter adhesin